MARGLTKGEGKCCPAARCNSGALLLVASVLLAACGGGGGGGGSSGGGGTQSQSSSPPSSGVNSTTLAWDTTTDPNVAGYRLYYGTAPGTYLQSSGQGLDVGNVNTFAVPVKALTSGTRYYVAARAYDTTGNESDFSNEVFIDVP